MRNDGAGNLTLSVNSSALSDDGTGKLTIATNAALPGAPTTTTPSAGDNSTKLATTAFVQSTTSFSKFFQSSGQAISGNTVSVAHGLGATPKGFEVFFQCISAEYDYSIGDRVLSSSMLNVSSVNQNCVVATWANATTVGVSMFNPSSNGTAIADKTSGARQIITPGNWELVFTAWL